MASRKTSRKKLPAHALDVPRGHSHEAALILSMLDDQSRLLLNDLRGIKPAELEWQPKRGMNTIGMLLAHLAIVEVYWLEVAAGRFTPAAIARGGGSAADAVQAILWPVLGVGFADAGMPLAKNARPPRNLKGWTFDDYRQLLGHARLHIAPRFLDFTDADLARKVARRRVNGEETAQSVRWILYHVLEHFSGHYGQILLLRHLYRDRRKAGSR
jgi:uncharacterized damage-inducible protein DinB